MNKEHFETYNYLEWSKSYVSRSDLRAEALREVDEEVKARKELLDNNEREKTCN